MIQFKPFKSGSSGNLYTVSDGHTTIMIECGLPWRRIRELLQYKTSEISGVLASHFHADHSKSLRDAAKAGLDVYASKETFVARGLSGHRSHEIEDGHQFSIGTWRIIPFKTIHDVEGSLAFYMVNQEGEAFLYLTDSSYSPVRFKGLSVIACECNFTEEILSKNILNGAIPAVVGRRIRRSHFSLENVIAFLRANDLSQTHSIFLLHLSNGNSDERCMIREVEQATGIPCIACGLDKVL
jgi:phosphoribosyl 1,2-cyclic phosphodiesterase